MKEGELELFDFMREKVAWLQINSRYVDIHGHLPGTIFFVFC
jgi:hypothetical protein